MDAGTKAEANHVEELARKTPCRLSRVEEIVMRAQWKGESGNFSLFFSISSLNAVTHSESIMLISNAVYMQPSIPVMQPPSMLFYPRFFL